MSSYDGQGDATHLMDAAARGDRAAANALMPLVFEQLRCAAQRQMMAERPGHKLSATALVHEAYLKLAGPREAPWAGRGHFHAAAIETQQRAISLMDADHPDQTKYEQRLDEYEAAVAMSEGDDGRSVNARSSARSSE